MTTIRRLRLKLAVYAIRAILRILTTLDDWHFARRHPHTQVFRGR